MVEFTQWRIVDSHWINTLHEFRDNGKVSSLPCFDGTLADYFFLIGIDIPDYVNYCLGHTANFSFKFRHSGNLIELFINN